jgi:hypothetical protein
VKRLVKFETRCGCSKIEEVDSPEYVQEFISLALMSDITKDFFKKGFDPSEPVAYQLRRFKFREVIQMEGQIVLVYREVE